MLKLKKVYICNSCGDIKLPLVKYAPCGAKFNKLPNGWKKIGTMHMCPGCAEAFLTNAPNAKEG